MFDITTGQSQQVAQHDAPIKVAKWIETPQGGILATGSWDKTLKVRVLFLFLWVGWTVMTSLCAVLGSEDCKSSGDSPAPGTMLHYGRHVSTSCRWNGRTPHPNIQPHKPHDSLQGLYYIWLSSCTWMFTSVGQTITSPLKWQTRVVSCFTNSPSSGFAVGSIEGRVAIQCVLMIYM